MLLTLLSFLFLQSAARADILFINLNNSALEQKACQDAARARGEKCVVVPAMDAKEIKKLNDVDSQLGSIYSKIDKGKLERTKAQPQLDELTEQKKKLSPQLDKAKLADAVKALVAADPSLTVSSIVLSGHHASGEFAGLDGSVKAKDMKEIFAQYPDVFGDTHGLFLAGCYTGNLGTIDEDWKDLTPNISMIVGYGGMAPAGSWQPGANFMRDVLSNEFAILNSQTKPELQAIFKKLKGDKLGGLQATICVNDCLVTGKGAESIEDIMARCQNLQFNADYQKGKTDFECYLNASSPKCLRPPDDMEKGPLRQSYNKIQEKSECRDLMVTKGSAFPDENRYSLLVHHRNVLENLNRLEGADLKRLAGDLADVGVEFHPEVFANQDKDQRKKILDEMKRVQDQIDQKQSDPEFLLGPKGLKLMKAEVQFWNVHSIADLWPGCLPFDWVNAGSVASSPCRNAPVADTTAKDQRSGYYANAIQLGAMRVKEQVMADVKVKTDTINATEWTPQQKAALARAMNDFKKTELDRIRRLVPKSDRASLENTLKRALQ